MTDDTITLKGTSKKPQPVTDEVATIAKDIDIFAGWLKRLENPDPVLRTEAAGKGLKLYDEVDRDAHASSVLQQRILAIVGKGWEILPAKLRGQGSGVRDQGIRKQEQVVADFVSEVLENCNFDQTRQEILRAILYGYYAVEALWQATAATLKGTSGITIKKLIAKHPRRFIFTPERELRLLTLQNMIEGEQLPDRKFIVFTYGDSDNPYGRGLGQKLWWPVWFKKNGVKFWLVFLEKFGMPTVKGKYPPGTDPTQQQALMDAIEAIQSDTGIKIPDSMDIEFLEASRAGTVTHEQLCDYMDRQISKAVLGQTLTTEIKGEGSYAASQTHNEIRQEIIEADADLLDGCLNDTLIRWIVDFNFPGVSAYPKIKTYAAAKPDLTAQSQIDKTLVVDIGLPVAKQYFYDTYGIPAPAEGEELVVPQRTNLGMPQGAFAEGDVKKNAEIGRAITAQKVIDNLADRKVSEAATIFENYREQIKAYLDDADNLEAAQENIANLYDRLDVRPLAFAMQAVLMAADRIGVASILGGEFAEASWGEGQPFEEAVDFFRAKAFTIAGVSKADLMAEVKDEILSSMKTGGTLKEFRRNADMLFEKHGYDRLSNFRIDTIYRTNMQAAYQAGRYRQMTDPAIVAARPYWRYVAVMDAATRPTHAALNGKIFPWDDPFWKTWYPPNGFNCRCTVQTVSQTELDREGWTLETKDPTGGLIEPIDPVAGNKMPARPLMPDPGWGDRGSDLANRLKKGSEPIVWKEKPGQSGPKELGRSAERNIESSLWQKAPVKIPRLETMMKDQAIQETEALQKIENIFRQEMGISPNEIAGVLKGPDGEIMKIDLNSLAHAMLKRSEARERYIPYFRKTIEEPYEIFLTEYQTEKAGKTKYRKKYIGLFRDENREGVVVVGEISPEGWAMWNVMNARQGTLDRQRRGIKVLYGK